MQCRHGHDLDPSDPWRSSNGMRCRVCYSELRKKTNRTQIANRARWNSQNMIQVSAGGARFSYRVDSERKEEYAHVLREFRDHLKQQYKEEADGGFNQTIT